MLHKIVIPTSTFPYQSHPTNKIPSKHNSSNQVNLILTHFQMTLSIYNLLQDVQKVITLVYD